MCRISFNNNFETITFNTFPVTVFDAAFFAIYIGVPQASCFQTRRETISRKRRDTRIRRTRADGSGSSARKIPFPARRNT